MSGAPNFLEEEDYETPAQAVAEPVFGQVGFGKGKHNPRRGTPRARATELDMPVLYFLGHFPGADTEACSMLTNAKKTIIGGKQIGGGLTSVATMKNRLDKLIRLGLVEKYRHPISGGYAYGLTEQGLEVMREYGFDMRGARVLKGISVSRLPHYRAIALVAAKFASPAGYFRKAGIEPVSLEQLIGEGRMRAAYAPVQKELKEKKQSGKSEDFGKWRAAKLEQALADVKTGVLPASELLDVYPILLTLGQPTENKAKAVKQPDLAVNLDSNRTEWASNLLIEVELSVKDHAEYQKIMATLAAELKTPHVYRRAIYFTTGSQVKTILKQIDSAMGYRLFETGKLTVAQLTGRDGEPIAQKKRLVVGGN